VIFQTMTTDETLISMFAVGGMVIFLMMAAAGWCKNHPANKPEISPTDPEDEEETRIQDAEALRQRFADTTRKCKNPDCGRIVSYKKITGDYCTFCHVANTPEPQTLNPREPVQAIPAEVREDA